MDDLFVMRYFASFFRLVPAISSFFTSTTPLLHNNFVTVVNFGQMVT